MAEYSEYKDSGQQWLGKVPSHWDVDKISAHFQERKATVSDTEYKPLSVTKNGVVPQLDSAAKSDNGDNRKLVCSGDFVANSRSDRKGSCGFSELYGSVSIIYIVAKPIDVNGKFYHYLFRCNDYVEEFYRNGHGIVADLWTTRYDEMKNIQIPIPPKEEQEAIVAYLDKVTADIDNAIAAKERIIASLEERRKIIITHAVSRGINPNAPLRDSGIDWLGQIPAHWEIRRLKNLISTPLQYGANEAPDDYSENLPRYIRITDITLDGQLKEENRVSLLENKAEKYMLSKGDILFARSGATVGKAYLFNEDIRACFAGYLIKATVNPLITPEFLMAYTQSKVYENWKNFIFNKATIQNIGADKYSNLQVPYPSIEEQKTIIKNLTNKLAPIETAIAQQKKLIELLRERKNIIINETVTGHHVPESVVRACSSTTKRSHDCTK